MTKKNNLYQIAIYFLVSLFVSSLSFAQVINDPLQGSTTGTQVGGTFTSEGYKPGEGFNHILYNVPSQVSNGYVEFEMKGFTPGGINGENKDQGFMVMFDGRGVGSNPSWAQFRDNYFRWNFHWRQNASVIKCVVNVAAPTSQRINSSNAVFVEDINNDGVVDINDRDWYDEPSGSSFSWDNSKSTWYTVRIEWNNKTYTASINGQQVWSNHKTGLYDYAPVDHKIWLGSGIWRYDSNNPDVVYRNFKLVNLGGSSSYLTVSPTNKDVSSSSGSTNFSVSSNVNWSANDDANWLDLSSSSGSGNATLTANYDENTTSSSRTGTINFSGGGINKSVTVSQEGQATSNYLTVSPSNRSVSSNSGSTTFNIDSDIDWVVSDDASWLNISASSGSGSDILTVTFDENVTTSSRTSEISVTGSGITRVVTVTQEGQTVDPFLTVTPANHNVSDPSGTVSFTIESNVTWQVTDNSDWLSKTPKNGSGNATLNVNYFTNSMASTRVAIIKIVGGGFTKDVTVTQSGGAAYLNISPSSQSVSDSAGNIPFTISSNVNWEISDNAEWLSLSTSSGSGEATFDAIFSENGSTESRTATITVTGNGISRTATISQTGAQVFEVTAETIPSGAGSISGTGSYIDNSLITLTCLPNDGWRFDRWVENGNSVSTDSVYSFTVTNSHHISAELSEISTGFSDNWNEIPNEYQLFNNYPNPFNPTTNIRYALPLGTNVKLSVFNLLGQKIVELVNGYKSEGFHSVNFNAENLPSGTYIYKIETPEFIQTKRLLLLK